MRIIAQAHKNQKQEATKHTHNSRGLSCMVAIHELVVSIFYVVYLCGIPFVLVWSRIHWLTFISMPSRFWNSACFKLVCFWWCLQDCCWRDHRIRWTWGSTAAPQSGFSLLGKRLKNLWFCFFSPLSEGKASVGLHRCYLGCISPALYP